MAPFPVLSDDDEQPEVTPSVKSELASLNDDEREAPLEVVVETVVETVLADSLATADDAVVDYYSKPSPSHEANATVSPRASLIFREWNLKRKLLTSFPLFPEKIENLRGNIIMINQVYHFV